VKLLINIICFTSEVVNLIIVFDASTVTLLLWTLLIPCKYYLPIEYQYLIDLF